MNTRRMSEYWDIPTIAANCCGYVIRLNTKRLEQNGASLSLSILAQCLLNGEVLDNGRSTNPGASKLTVWRYLKDAISSEFNSNRRQYNLIFKKSCHFFDVSLTAALSTSQVYQVKSPSQVKSSQVKSYLSRLVKSSRCTDLT
jgi:hypothetical protein